MFKKIIGLLIIILWMLVIFNFSSKASNISNCTSKGIINIAIMVYEHATNKTIDSEKWINILNYPVRKLAHFTEYFILGLLLYQYLKFFKFKYSYVYAGLIAILFACSDEYHQLYVSGRTGQIKDVIVDASGVIIALIITYIIEKKQKIKIVK